MINKKCIYLYCLLYIYFFFFQIKEIDGDVFLMLNQKDLTDVLNIPLGPALKLCNAIVVLRQRASAYDIANGLL